MSNNDYLSPEGFHFTYSIDTDPFSKKTSIQWGNVGGDLFSHGFKMGRRYAIEYSWTFVFTSNDRLPFLSFVYYRKVVTSSKSKLLLLFDDGALLEYPLSKGGASRIACNYNEVLIPLYKEDLACLTSKLLKMVRVQINDNIVFTDDFFPDDTRSPLLFQSYAKTFVLKVLPDCNVSIPEKGKELNNRSSDQDDNLQAHSEACSVYLMVDTANGYHKIGISNKPQYRERTLQSEKPSIEMVIAKEFPSRQIARAFEDALHKTFESKHIRGEWFKLSDSDVEDIVHSLKK